MKLLTHQPKHEKDKSDRQTITRVVKGEKVNLKAVQREEWNEYVSKRMELNGANFIQSTQSMQIHF